MAAPLGLTLLAEDLIHFRSYYVELLQNKSAEMLANHKELFARVIKIRDAHQNFNGKIASEGKSDLLQQISNESLAYAKLPIAKDGAVKDKTQERELFHSGMVKDVMLPFMTDPAMEKYLCQITLDSKILNHIIQGDYASKDIRDIGVPPEIVNFGKLLCIALCERRIAERGGKTTGSSTELTKKADLWVNSLRNGELSLMRFLYEVQALRNDPTQGLEINKSGHFYNDFLKPLHDVFKCVDLTQICAHASSDSSSSDISSSSKIHKKLKTKSEETAALTKKIDISSPLLSTFIRTEHAVAKVEDKKLTVLFVRVPVDDPDKYIAEKQLEHTKSKSLNALSPDDATEIRKAFLSMLYKYRFSDPCILGVPLVAATHHKDFAAGILEKPTSSLLDISTISFDYARSKTREKFHNGFVDAMQKFMANEYIKQYFDLTQSDRLIYSLRDADIAPELINFGKLYCIALCESHVAERSEATSFVAGSSPVHKAQAENWAKSLRDGTLSLTAFLKDVESHIYNEGAKIVETKTSGHFFKNLLLPLSEVFKCFNLTTLVDNERATPPTEALRIR